jgi:lysophospholipase L1-like esterase
MSTASPSPAATTVLRRRRLLKLKVLALFVLFSGLVAVILVELMARVLFRSLANDARYFAKLDKRILCSFPTLEPKGGPKFGAALTPNASKEYKTHEYSFTVRTNSLGFRTREIAAKEPGEYRVMLVGDSFFFCLTPDQETVASQLERKAQETEGLARTLKVYNFAIMGYTTVQELLVARTYAPAVKPDHLVVGMLPMNDMVPNAVQYIDDQENLQVSAEQVKRVQADVRSRIGWLRHSMIFRMLSMLSPYGSRVYYEVAQEPDILAKNYALLEELKAFCDRSRIRLTVVMLYTGDSIQGGWLADFTQSRAAIRMLVDYGRQHGIDVVDELDFIHGGPQRREYHYRTDGHLNAKGNRRLAEIIFDQALEKPLRSSPEPSAGRLSAGSASASRSRPPAPSASPGTP